MRKPEVMIYPTSKTVIKILKIMQEQGYLGKYEVVNDAKGGLLKLYLLGNINKCGVIKPRFSIRKSQMQQFEKRFLPARNVGIIIMTTPKGIMTHTEAKKQSQGGKLLAYVY
ncbi:30S ribosomal protein S8 [Candidatus Woesearchaeota archaeon]|nr:30S ribosomal protein S8 [Candidatus Woesearchaeota archaeon]